MTVKRSNCDMRKFFENLKHTNALDQSMYLQQFPKLKLTFVI